MGASRYWLWPTGVHMRPLASQFPSWSLSFFIFKMRGLDYKTFKVFLDSSAQ